MKIIDKAFVKKLIPKRNLNSHKGSFGTLFSMCGSAGFAGAAVLSSKAALRCGVGIVNVALPKCIYNIVSQCVPEAIFTLLRENSNGTVCKRNIDTLETGLKKSTACLIGCGLGCNRDTTDVVSYLLKNYNRPILLDADGINSISSNIDVLTSAKSQLVLTPHPGEMARMLKTDTTYVVENSEKVAREFSKRYGKIIVLKGSKTVISSPNGELFINNFQNSGLAKGGSGDILSGMIASFLAQGADPLSAAILGVYLHSMAGKVCANKLSERAMLPSDIIDALPELFLDF